MQVTSTRVALVGASMAANKGAAAMLETVLETLPKFAGPCNFAVLSTYPASDRRRLADRNSVTVFDLSPARLAFVEIPLAVLGAVLRMARVPKRLQPMTKTGRALASSDLVVDLAGISFADGRGIPILGYNALMTGVGLLHGTTTIKAAQALGTFERKSTRLAARAVLPRLAWIGARGGATADNLGALGLTNSEEVADLAFSLPESAILPDYLAQQLKSVGEYVVLMPSAVVRGLATKVGIDYVVAQHRLVRGLRSATGLAVVIAPHSYREGKPESRMNDGPVCREVYDGLDDDEGVLLLDDDFTAGELRAVVAGSTLLVTSRFHAMISGLATKTPTLVVGWSHKYREVLSEFGLERFGLSHEALSDPSAVVESALVALRETPEIQESIRAALPGVRARSARNFEVMASFIRAETE